MTEDLIPKKVKNEIKSAIAMRAAAKGLEEEAEGLKKTANALLLPIMVAYEIKTYAVEGVGKVMQKEFKGSSINGTKLREQLALAGLSPQKINAVITKASTSWSREYVEFRVK